MPIYTKDKINIFFSHIPKCGGESITHFFENNGYSLHFHLRSPGCDKLNKPCSLQHRDNKDPDLLNFLSNTNITYSFTIVRDPLYRIVSEFFMRQLQINNKTVDDFSRFVIRAFTEYKKNPYAYDNHIKPQVNFIHPNINIFKFGDFNKIYDTIKSIDPSIKNSIIKHNSGNETKPFNGSYEYAREILKWEINSELKSHILDFYKEDYDFIDSANFK